MVEPITVFEWPEVATDAVCEQIAALAGAPATPVAEIRSRIGPVLSHAGGLPMVPGETTTDDLASMALGLVQEAVRHALAELGFAVQRRGVVVEGGRLVAVDRIDINSADERRLERLPVIGPATAAAIVAERRNGGWFRSAADLADRVAGIGDRNVARLTDLVAFARPGDKAKTLASNQLGLNHCLPLLLEQTAERDPVDRLLAGLELVAEICAGSPHPAVREKRIRESVRITTTAHPTDEVQVLDGSRYYTAVRSAIDAASRSIEVAMFHIALPSANHPTRALLDALVAAKQRNVAVRVLVDRDEPSDPYNSEIINQPALDQLRAQGVACRSDRSDRLLHSKFLVIDAERVIIGSHNWSAGSYFRFDDSSVAITSASYAAAMTQRFEDLWAEGEP